MQVMHESYFKALNCKICSKQQKIRLTFIYYFFTDYLLEIIEIVRKNINKCLMGTLLSENYFLFYKLVNNDLY